MRKHRSNPLNGSLMNRRPNTEEDKKRFAQLRMELEAERRLPITKEKKDE